jgi:hypothetical protein
MRTKIGLPENRKRLQGGGPQYSKNQSFDEGYNAGFDAGLKIFREKLANDIHQLGINSLHYDGNNALVYAYQAIQVARGEQVWEYFVEREKAEYQFKSGETE